MYLCYVDEAGCTGTLPAPTSPIQPVFVLAAVAFPAANLSQATMDFLRLKRRFFPALTAMHPPFLDSIRHEVKGSELRRDIAVGTAVERAHAIGFLDRVIALLERFDARIFGRAWIKGIGVPFDGTAVYTFSIQSVCVSFQSLLATNSAAGFVIADSRRKTQNANVSHSIFTQKFRAAGDPFDRILEMPTFGHSDNHVGLQIADLVCSALLFPMAVHNYCTGHIANIHVRPGYEQIVARYGKRLKGLQHRFQGASGKWQGGITVHDALATRPGGLLFRV